MKIVRFTVSTVRVRDLRGWAARRPEQGTGGAPPRLPNPTAEDHGRVR